MDKSVQALDAQITASKEPRVNELFREAWRGFTSRWQIDRDAWLESGFTRKFGFNEARYEEFRSAFLKWEADFNRRIPGAAVAPPQAIPVEPRTPLFGNLFAGTGTALMLTALVIGGFLFINQRRK